MKICVDPGHGMANRSPGVFDPGATHREGSVLFREADIALRYGLSLRDAFRARGVSVFMTRDDNDDVAPVGRRAASAEAARCDAFISLHLNDVESDSANGTETLYRDDADKEFARRVQGAVLRALRLEDRGLKVRDNLAVLRFRGPAILIELGFIGNDGDRNRILDPSARAATCEEIVSATLATLDGAATVAGNQAIPGGVDGAADADADDAAEADFDLTEEAYYDPAAPLFAANALLTEPAQDQALSAMGVTAEFDRAAFEAKVRSWNLRHFAPAEFLFLGASHHVAGPCRGLNSLPPPELWDRMETTAKMIDEIRERFGHPIRIISGYRSPEYNHCVDGKPNSLHLKFNALDFTNTGGTVREMYAIALDVRNRNRRFEGGIGYYPGKSFVHIDTRGRRADWRG